MWTAYSILKRTNYIKIELNIFTIIQETAKKNRQRENNSHIFQEKNFNLSLGISMKILDFCEGVPIPPR